MSLIENGWYQFMESLNSFWIRLVNRADGFIQRHQSDFQPITLDEFKYPIIVYCLHVIGITLIFMCEIIWFHIQERWRRFYNRCKQFVVRNIRKVFT